MDANVSTVVSWPGSRRFSWISVRLQAIYLLERTACVGSTVFKIKKRLFVLLLLILEEKKKVLDGVKSLESTALSVDLLSF